MKYDVFLSYRREGGFETAKHLHDLLTRDGYKVSFDIDTLRNGDFDKQLYSRIEECKDFIIILDANAFKRTLDPKFPEKNDWMRNELAYALQRNKNIIPIMLSGFKFPDNLPADIAAIEMKNCPTYTKEYFEVFYQKLCSFMITKPRKNPLLFVIPALLIVAAAVAAYVFLFDHTPAEVKDETTITTTEETKVKEVAQKQPATKPAAKPVTKTATKTTTTITTTQPAAKAKTQPKAEVKKLKTVNLETEDTATKFEAEKFEESMKVELARLEDATLEAKEAFQKLAKEKLNEEATRGELPQWVFAKQGNGRYIGVSDPHVTAEEGFEQALIRAWLLFQASQSIKMESSDQSYEISSGSNTTSKFTSMQKIESKKTLDVTLTPFKQHISNHGEYFIEFASGKSGDEGYVFKSSPSNSILISKFSERKTVNDKYESQGRLNVTIKLAKYVDKTSHIYQPNKKSYSYKNTTSEPKSYLRDQFNEYPSISITPTTDGYWATFISSLISCANSRIMSEEVTSGGTYSEYQQTTNNTTTRDIKISLHNADINDNDLYTRWDIEVK